MKVAELEGAELDFFVAKAEGYDSDNLSSPEVILRGKWTIQGNNCAYITRQVSNDVSVSNTYAVCDVKFSPSTNWSQGGPIIERERINIVCWATPMGNIQASYSMDFSEGQAGDSMLIAAMRAFVASKFGEETGGDA